MARLPVAPSGTQVKDAPTMRLLAFAAMLTACLGAGRCGNRAETTMPAIATACFGCHGPQGRSTGAIPALAGLPAEEFVQRMATFRNGAGTVMRHIAPAYSPAQVHRLAAYFASLEPKM
ncbi:MAG: hypothetical protein L0H19_06300 [Salinisphaera sp.]|nr:hypothetical protein [Salinisphaera sp.]